MADWRDILSQVRRYTGDGFSRERGYDPKRGLNFGQRMAVLKYWRKIEELNIYGSAVYTPKPGEKNEIFSLTGQKGYRKFTKAILKVPRPGAKVRVTVDKSRPKGNRVILEDITRGHRARYYNIPPEILMDAIEEAEENDELPGDMIEDVLSEYAPDAKFFMVRTDSYYAWGMALGDSGQKKRIGERVYQLMMDYGADKFDENNPNSSYFGNWFKGITGFTNYDDPELIIRSGAQRRSQYLLKHRRHLAATSARDRYRRLKDGRIALFNAGRFQQIIEEEGGADSEEYIKGWNAYIDAKTEGDNPYDQNTERVQYRRWLMGFLTAENIAADGQTLRRR